MTTMTHSEAFSIAANHLLKQGRRCDDEDSCLYRGEGGMKCAVGALIADEFYSTELERRTVYSEEVTLALAQSGVEILDRDFRHMLVDLQNIHDHKPAEQWPESLANLAKEYGIDWRPEA